MSLSESRNPNLSVIRNELVYEKDDQSVSAEDFIRLHQTALNLPDGLTIVRGKASLERHIPHGTIPGVKLQVGWANSGEDGLQILPGESDFNLAEKASTYRQLGVIEPDGIMYFGVEQREIKNANFDNPFLKMIMDYFASHLSGA